MAEGELVTVSPFVFFVIARSGVKRNDVAIQPELSKPFPVRLDCRVATLLAMTYPRLFPHQTLIDYFLSSSSQSHPLALLV